METYTYLGLSAAHGTDIAITAAERARHIAVIGATGMGKSTLLKTIIQQDIARGDGVMLIDPHGDLAEYALDIVPSWRTNHVCYLSPADLERPVGFNVLERVHPDQRSQAAENVVAALRGIWSDSWGASMEDILRYTLLALLEMPGASLAVMRPFLTDATYRRRVLAHCRDPFTRAYFETTYDAIPERELFSRINPILNKVGAFIAAPAIRNVFGQSTSTLDLAHVMSRGHIVIANLAKGRLGDAPSSYTGALLIGVLKTAVMARAALPPEQRRVFHVIIDELQLFGTELIATLFSEARKYNLTITTANQDTHQLSPAVRAAVLANAGTIALFRPSLEDAEFFARRFQMDAAGLLGLTPGHVFIDGQFAETYAPTPTLGLADKVKAQSAYRYGRQRRLVEQRVVTATSRGVRQPEQRLPTPRIPNRP